MSPADTYIHVASLASAMHTCGEPSFCYAYMPPVYAKLTSLC
jgi:hypothetical protein